jgi:hypothetical protein
LNENSLNSSFNYAGKNIQTSSKFNFRQAKLSHVKIAISKFNNRNEKVGMFPELNSKENSQRRESI